MGTKKTEKELNSSNKSTRASLVDIPSWKPSPDSTSKRFSQIAFPIIVLPKDDRTDLNQEERPDLPYWTMMLAICVVVDESKSLDIPIWEFFKICEHLPFLLGF